jgi:hypothetical protein
MGAHKQFESLEHLINTSKPIKWVCSKYIGNLIGLLTWRFDKTTVLIAHET